MLIGIVGRRLLPTAFVLTALLAGCTATERRDAPAALDGAGDDLALLKSWMIGSFSSAEQSAADPENFFDIRLEIVPIWRDRDGGAWMYVEQAAAQSLDKPYRQRIYQVTAAGDGVFESAVYELPGDPLAYAGAWKTPEKLDAIKPEDLQQRAGCTVHLRKQDGATFAGRTIGTGCTSALRGAKYATSEVSITAEGMRTWDRGYNEANEQVWGAKTGPYVFKKVAASGG
ncbi:MAG: chromophore lyase CpcT/CpeT [Phycisphaerae bacterium]|nr:chromophore lyase CpcT/CpeT [Phycisphaerae bacterium]